MSVERYGGTAEDLIKSKDRVTLCVIFLALEPNMGGEGITGMTCQFGWSAEAISTMPPELKELVVTELRLQAEAFANGEVERHCRAMWEKK